MFQKPYQKILIVSLIAGIIFWWSGNNLKAVNIHNPFSPAQQFSVIESFKKCLISQFTKSKFIDNLNFNATVSIIAIPAKKPVGLEEIEKGAIVGAVFFSTGSFKYRLPPGSYTVSVTKENNVYFATFLDNSGDVKQKLPARIILGEPADSIMASLEYSICYRINGGIVCI